MRIEVLTCAAALLLATYPAAGQRIADIAPGMLVRLTMRQGATAIGPLAEVKVDTVYLSSTVRKAERSVALASITEYHYADGEVAHPGVGALIGGSIGLALAYAGGRSENDDFRIFSSNAGRVIMFILGAIPGALIGGSDRSPRWVSAGAP